MMMEKSDTGKEEAMEVYECEVDIEEITSKQTKDRTT
jgi:hypothetical protein